MIGHQSTHPHFMSTTNISSIYNILFFCLTYHVQPAMVEKAGAVPQAIPNVPQYQGIGLTAAAVDTDNIHGPRPLGNNNYNTEEDYEEDDDEHGGSLIGSLSFSEVIQQKGIFALIQMIFTTIYKFIQTSLENFPIATATLTWYFIIQAAASIAVRWVQGYFYFNLYTTIPGLAILHFLLPHSIPSSIFSIVFMAYYGARVEEQRGSSYLIVFFCMMFIMVQATMYILNVGLFSNTNFHLLSTTWYNHLGLDYIPFSLILLNSFLSGDYHVQMMGIPYRLHVCIAMFVYVTLVGFTQFTIPYACYIALILTFIFKYVWLNQTYSKFASLLLTPMLCKFQALEYNIGFEPDIRKHDEMCTELNRLKHYVISQRTSEQMGDIVGIHRSIPAAEVRLEYAQRIKRPFSHKSNKKKNYLTNSSASMESPNTSAAASPSGNGSVSSLQFNTLNGSNSPSESSKDPFGLPRNNSESSTGFLSPRHSGHSETTGLLNTDSDDENYVNENNQCIAFQDYYDEAQNNGMSNCTVKNIVQHLKFRHIIYRLDHKQLYPDAIRFITVKDTTGANQVLANDLNNSNNTSNYFLSATIPENQ